RGRLLRLPRKDSRGLRPGRRAQRGCRLDIPPPPPTLHGRRAGATDRRRCARALCTCAARAPAGRRLTLDLFDAMKKRRMHRAFAPDPVPRELMDKMLYAAGRAAT